MKLGLGEKKMQEPEKSISLSQDFHEQSSHYPLKKLGCKHFECNNYISCAFNRVNVKFMYDKRMNGAYLLCLLLSVRGNIWECDL